MKTQTLRAAGWTVKVDPLDGRRYAAKDTNGAGMCCLTPPTDIDDAPLSEWIHPSWMSPTEFEALPEAKE